MKALYLCDATIKQQTSKINLHNVTDIPVTKHTENVVHKLQMTSAKNTVVRELLEVVPFLLL